MGPKVYRRLPLVRRQRALCDDGHRPRISRDSVNTTEGFGFITPDGSGKDAFVHISALERSGISSLNEVHKVSYDLESGRDGKVSAANLKLLR